MTKPKTTYEKTLSKICKLYEQAMGPGLEARRKRTITKFWEISRQIEALEQSGAGGYGSGLVARLSADLTRKYGKGFKERTVFHIKDFSKVYSLEDLDLSLTWSHYRTLVSVEDHDRRAQ